MTVQDLIATLRHEDPNAEVYFEHPSHDYWRTQLASPVVSNERKLIRFDEYHNQYSIPRTEYHEEDTRSIKSTEKRVVILKDRR